MLYNSEILCNFAQGVWGPRKFIIFGESGGTSRLNADVVSSQYDLVAERERYLCARGMGSPLLPSLLGGVGGRLTRRLLVRLAPLAPL